VTPLRRLRNLFRRPPVARPAKDEGTQDKEARAGQGGGRPAASTGPETRKSDRTEAKGRERNAPKSGPLQKKRDGSRRTRVSAETEAHTRHGTGFDRFGLHPDLLRALVDDLGFTTCTPIQEHALPHCLSGKDVAGQAQTGTGKTAAFLVTIFQRLLDLPEPPDRLPYALVIAPTRELAIQIDRDARKIGRHCGFRTAVVYGGIGLDAQRSALNKGVHLLTATPGRLLDLVRRNAVDLSGVRILVIDEADRMLDMGFIPDVRRIIGRLPRREKRQTLLFSATLSDAILRLASRWMRDPVRITVEPEQVVAPEIEERVYAVSSREKLAVLLWLLRHEAGERVLVFRNRRDACRELVLKLRRYGVNCELLTGDVPQAKRIKVLDEFRAGRIRVIVATDVAGRGIHVENISHVVNYDLPYEPEDYVHRIGRTGRAGARGVAVSFACEEGAFVIPEIEEFIGRPLKALPPTPEMLRMPPPVAGAVSEPLPRVRPPRKRRRRR